MKNFMNSLGSLDRGSFIKCLTAFDQQQDLNLQQLEIVDVGFNPNSGYVFIALEPGVTIISSVNQEVEYLGADDTPFETYSEALASFEEDVEFGVTEFND